MELSDYGDYGYDKLHNATHYLVSGRAILRETWILSSLIRCFGMQIRFAT